MLMEKKSGEHQLRLVGSFPRELTRVFLWLPGGGLGLLPSTA